MSKSPWQKVGAWAAEAEREEAEELAAAAASAAAKPQTFPTLKESSLSTTTKPKGKKTKMSLHEFTMQHSAPSPNLPTAPNHRSSDEVGRSNGLGFQNREPRVSGLEPSRSDGVDNWGSTKKNTIPVTEFKSRVIGKYESRADDVDNWGSVKKPVVVHPETVKVNPFGAARPREEVLAEKGLDWKKLDSEIEVKKTSLSSRPGSEHSSRPGSSHSIGVGESEVVKTKVKVNPFGDAKPREVLLEEKGLDWRKIDLDLELRRVERPDTEEEKKLKEEIEHLKNELQQKSGDDQTSINNLIIQRQRELDILVRQLDDKVHYSQKIFDRPGSGSGRGAGFSERPPSRPGSGSGRGASFSERPPSRPGPYEESRPGFHHEELRAGYTERPHSRSGMYDDHRAGFHDRRPSWTGAYEDPRFGSHERPRFRQGVYEEPRGGFSQRPAFNSGAYQEPTFGDYNERPRSRGTGNSWARQSDDRTVLQGGGGRGFLGSRDMNRSSSRW